MDHVSSQTWLHGLRILAEESIFWHFLSKREVLILRLLMGLA